MTETARLPRRPTKRRAAPPERSRSAEGPADEAPEALRPELMAELAAIVRGVLDGARVQ